MASLRRTDSIQKLTVLDILSCDIDSVIEMYAKMASLMETQEVSGKGRAGNATTSVKDGN